MLLFVLRMLSINEALIDPQDWRQADGYSIARNFLEVDPNPMYPRIDHAGNLTGIMGSEFPLMNYLVYLIYLVTGVQWWPARLISLIASSIGTYFFYKLVRDFIKREIAFTATIVVLFSIWLSSYHLSSL